MIRYRWAMAGAAASAGLAFGVLGWGEGYGAPAAPPAAAQQDPVPALLKSPADVERGRQLFVGTCGAYCHKMAPGPSDAPFLFDCDWLHGGSDQQIFHTISQGVPGTRMIAFGGALPDADIWRLVAYLKSASQCKR